MPAAQGAAAITAASLNTNQTHETYNVTRPKRRAPSQTEGGRTKKQYYLDRLESCLPPHLRSDASTSVTSNHVFIPNAQKLAKFALESDSYFKGVLRSLVVHEGRWRAAVWIVKLLLEHYHAVPPQSNRLTDIVQDWNRSGTLDELLEDPLYLVPRSGEPLSPHLKTSSAANLHELTDNKPEGLSRSELLRHDVLGLVWRNIGYMIISCANDHDIAGGEVKPEILEMIALLHHYELMPASIYAYVPAESEDAIQQPPTLHLLSSRIFTALSDATWRAREMSAVEEAKRKGGELMSLEAKGSSYRVRVSGIKPEIWLELILWSCLHGGWVLAGVSLLRKLHSLKVQSEEQWTPISWRDSLSAIMPFGQKDLLDWDSIKYMFDTRSSATMDSVDATALRVKKTVSSEVVNAYIDALLSSANVGVGERGLVLKNVMRSIGILRLFLQRANLNLGGGSWDAMMLRLVESGGIDVERDPHLVQELIALSPSMGEELQSRRSQVIPAYVLDGSAAILGLLHRALYAEIRNSNLDGAFKVFSLLQERVDNDRHQSLRDFFSRKQPSSAPSDTSADGLFTSNFSGIEYPSFSTQIPPSTLAAFLDLVAENKLFAFGKWMLGTNHADIDGPLIPPALYSDPHISAAIVHFATKAQMPALLSKITKLGAAQPDEDGNAPTTPSERLRAFFDAQVEMKRWDAAQRILEHMHQTQGFHWNTMNAASVAKAMILDNQTTEDSIFSEPTPTRAQAIFSSMLMGRHSASRQRGNFRAHIQTLALIMATVSPDLAARVRSIQGIPHHLVVSLNVSALNAVLEGVVATHGSEAGRALVDRFIIADQLENPDAAIETSLGHETPNTKFKRKTLASSPPPMPQFLRDAVEAERLPRAKLNIVITNKPRPQTTAMYGRLKLGPTTVRIVVRRALQERSESRNHATAARSEQSPGPQSPITSSVDIFVWALHTLRRGGLNRHAVLEDMSGAEGLSGAELELVRERAAKAWRAYCCKRGWEERDGDRKVRKGEDDVEDGERELDAFDYAEREADDES